jgi:maltose 6'-phosphate phosphatase
MASTSSGGSVKGQLGGTTRIATYNLWNSTFNWEQRLAAIVDELHALAADVVLMQEAPNEVSQGRSLAAYFEAESRYRHVLHLAYDVPPDNGERPEGLALLSHFPLRDIWTNWGRGSTTHNNWAARVAIEVPGQMSGRTLGITNVHLDWEHENRRVQGIVDIVENLIEHHPADTELLCGDFNDSEDGRVAAYLEGRIQIEGAGANLATSWQDVVASSVGLAIAPVTLDFVGNPRWKDVPVHERPGRFDRIYLRSASGQPAPRVTATGLFGHQPANRFGIVPSDHYGVFVDLEF